MPSTSVAQQHFFGGILGGAIKKPKGMTLDQVKDFARTSTKGLPEHKADGRKPMTNSVFQQSEPVRGGKRPAWMEAGGGASTKKQPMLAEGDMPKTNGRPPGAYRVRAKAAMMADGKKPEKGAAGAFAHAGEPGHSLHATLGVPKDEKIPADKMQKALHSSNLHTKRMALAAHNI